MENANLERFTTHSGELQFYDKNGKILNKEELEEYFKKNSDFEFYPINSIVQFKNIDWIMIIKHHNFKATDSIKYDYAGYKYNNGIIEDKLYMFNHDDVELYKNENLKTKHI